MSAACVSCDQLRAALWRERTSATQYMHYAEARMIELQAELDSMRVEHSPPLSCNRHEDCGIADELGGQLGVYVSHCHEIACEQCTKGRRHG